MLFLRRGEDCLVAAFASYVQTEIERMFALSRSPAG
jgi:hypothetical protein